MKVFGVDTLEFGIDVENYDNNFSELLFSIDKLKTLSQEEHNLQTITINGIKFYVNSKGQGFYAYKIECEQFYVCFSSRSTTKNSPIFVRFMSEFLWEFGFENALYRFFNWFSSFNIKLLGTRISRLDITLDIDEFVFLKTDIENFVTRANKLARHYVDSDYYTNNQFSGFTIGRGGKLSCRIYNKTLEIKNSKKNWFYNIWKSYDWQEKNEVWRIEFQIRRKILKEFNIDTINDIKDNIEGIWGYLTQKWLLLKEFRSDSNKSRCKIDYRWSLVQKAAYNYLPKIQLRNIIKFGHMETLMNQCIGLMVSISALCNFSSLNDAYLYIANYVREKNKKNNTTFQNEVEKRKQNYI